MVRKGLLWAALTAALFASAPAFSQSVVVTSCGSMSPHAAQTAGNQGEQTVDVNGNLCSNAAGGGTTTVSVPSVGTNGATAPTSSDQAGGVYNTSAPTPSAGQFVPLQVDASGNLKVTAPATAPVNVTVNTPPNDVGAGPASFTGAGTLVVSSQGSGSVGILISGTYTGAAWTLQGSVDGVNYATIPFWDNTSNGVIYTAQPSATSGGTYVAFAAGYKSIRVNVTAVGTGTLIVCLNASAGSAQHPVSNQGVNSNINGIAGSAVAEDPCTWQTKTNLAISTNTTSLSQIIAASGSKKIYICSIQLVAAGATAFNLNTGTGTNCGSSTAALLGSTTAANGMSLAANGGFTTGNGGATIAVTAASSEICTLQSNSVYVSGNITYVQQ